MRNEVPPAPRRPAVSDVLRGRAAATPDREAFVFLRDGEHDAVRVTYRALDERARAHAALVEEVAPPPDADGPARVLLLHPPGVDFVAAFFGILYAGLVPVPAYVPRGGRGMPRLQAIVADCGASIVLTSAMAADAMAKAGGPLGRARTVLSPSAEDTPALARAWRERDADPEACALLQYTSGSTSQPKGVVLRHRQLSANTAAIATAFGTGPSSVGVIWLPPYHDMGLIGGLLQPIAVGFPVVLMSPMAFLQRPARWLEAVARHGGTISGGPNFAYDLVAKKMSTAERAALDLSSWSTAFCGAEPIRAATLARFADAFDVSGFRSSSFVSCYGLAEATLLVTGARLDRAPRIDEGLTNVVGCGPVAEGTKVVVVHPETGAPGAEGTEGEIWVAGPGVADGYFRAPEATRAAFDARLADDPARYLRTGDLGYLRGGELFVTGRTKELIIVRGRKFHPRDIEEVAQAVDPALRAHAGAAFSSRGGVVLVQELERGARPDLARVAEAIRDAVSGAIDVALDAVLLVRAGTVPVTSSGKIQRAACRAAFEDGSIEVVYEIRADQADDPLSVPTIAVARAQTADVPTATRSAARIASLLRIDEARLAGDVPLTALGLDSLAAVEVQAFARAAGTSVTIDELLAGMTWATLERRLDAAASARAPQVTPRPTRAEAEPASHVEMAAVTHAIARPDSSALVVAVAGWIEGDVDPEALTRAVRSLESRHDALRTTFDVSRDGTTVLRRVTPACRAEVAVLRCEEADVARALAAEAWKPFDVGAAPLFRVTVAEVGARRALLLAAHHAIVDLASLEILFRDLGALLARELGEPVTLPALPLQASDAARLERAFVAHEAEAVARRWEDRLPHPLPVLDLPRDAPRTAAPLRPAGVVPFAVPATTASRVRELARATNSSTFTILLTTYHLLLHHWSGQADIVIGSEAAGRTRADLLDVVGSFARPLPIRATVDRARTFAESAAALRGALVGALEDQAYPFLAIVDRLVAKGAAFDRAAPPVFQAVFNFTRDRGDGGLAAVALGRSDGTLSAGPLRLRTIGLPPVHAHSEIALLAADSAADGPLELAVLHDADLFSADAMERFASDFGALLGRVVQAPDATVDALLGQLPRRRIPIRVAANFTATPIEPSLRYWLELAGLPPAIDHLPYDGLLTALHDGSLRGPGANVLLVRCEALARDGAGGNEAAIARNMAALVDALAAFGAAAPPPTVLAVTPADDPSLHAGREHLLSWARAQPWLAAVDLSEVAARYEVQEPFDRDAMALGDAPLSEAMAAAAGAVVARALRCALVPAKKIVAVDADGTLWGGVAAEDGPAGVRVDGPYAELQKRLVALHDAGMLVAVVSKNAEADVAAVFEQRREMPLRREHLVALRASWTSKSDVVRVLAAELELGLDAFVFLDDNPVECAAMRAACPEVLVVPLPDRADAIPRTLDAVWELDRPRATEEDRRRAQMYREEAGRASSRARAGSLAAFLASLELVVEITRLGPEDVPRAAQLTQRTNQLNTTTKRMTEAEVAALRDAWVVRVRDRFGDYGLVGLLALEHRARDLHVRAFLLSCRALGRGVEARLVAWLGERARQLGAERIVFAYERTARNEPARRMLEAIGGAPVREATAEIPLVDGAVARVTPAETTEPSATAPTAPVRGRISGARLLDAALAGDRADAIVSALAAGRRRRRRTGTARPLVGTEVLVAGAWSEVLGIEGIEADDDLFALGATSLHALALAARLRRALGVDVDLSAVFEQPRLEDFARLVDARGRSGATDVAVHVDSAAPVPATSMQRRLWLLHRVDASDPAYHVPLAARIEGRLEPRAWVDAFTAIVKRHEALRLRFVARDDEPYLVAGDGSDVALAVVDVAPEALDAWLAARIREPFDLDRGPLVRATLARIHDEHHVLLVVLHHAVADGASLGLLVRELAAGVRGVSPLGEAPSWMAHARATAARDPGPERRALDAARTALAGLLPLEIALSAPRPDAAPSARGAVAVREIPAARAATVRELARATGTTAFTVVLAAYASTLARLAGRDDVGVGIAVSTRDDARWQDLVGPLVNTVVARVRLDGELDVRGLVARAHEAAQRAYARAAVPFERLVAALVSERDPARAPLVQVMLVEQPSAAAVAPADALPGVRVTPMAVASGGAQLDLTLAMSHEPSGALRLALEHRTDRVSARGAEAFLERLEHVLAAMAEAPARPAATLPLVTDDERRRVLHAWAGERRPYATDEGLARAFERQVDRTPDAPAVWSAEGTFTYAELEAAANRLAHALIARGIRRGDPVGIALPRSRALVASIHACLKIGAPYVPLEPDLPPARLAGMIEDASVGTVLCGRELGSSFGARALVAEDVIVDGTHSAERLRAEVTGRDLAYVMYTSGSSGKPKGVMVEHRGVENRLRYQEDLVPLRPGEAVLHKTPYGFDVSVWELLWPLRVGGHLIVAPPGAHKDPDAIVALVEHHGVTTLHFVPSMLGAFVEADGLERLGTLTRVFASGEALPRDTVVRLRRRLPRVVVHNLYGPTEASIEVTHLAIPEGPVGPITIGRPIPNTRIYVVDGRGELLPPGASGELVIAGPQVARGYLGDAERTQAAFGDDPFVADARIYRTGDLARFDDDGSIEFLGRKDRQVKIRGNRVELGEIEAALRAHPEVDAAVVVLRQGRLVAYVVGRAAEEVLRAHLATRLTDAMLPAAYVALPELPIGPSGKVAFDRLPAPPRVAAATNDAPTTPAERTLAEIWSSVLGSEGIDGDADFFALGGDSILALKVVSRARARGLALTPRDVFERPTLRGLAARASASSPVAAEQTVAPGARVPLLPMQAAFFARHAAGVRDRFGQSIRITSETPLDPDVLARALDVVAAAHPALATRFVCEGDRVVGQVRPVERPYGVARVLVAGEGDLHALATAAVRVDGPLVAAAVSGIEAVLAVHHAVIDAVSWRVVLPELGAAYAALASGETVAATAPDATFAWAAALDAWARSDDARTEADGWRDRFAHLPAEAYASGLEGSAGAARDADVLDVALDRTTTTRLFEVLRATFAEVDVALSGALSVALDGDGSFRVVDVERHGRDATLGTALDLPRAVGWLTATFPVAIRVPRAGDARAALEAAREAFAAVPHGGVGFGALDVPLPARSVVVNYVGAEAGVDARSGLRFADASSPADRDPEGPRDHVLEVVARLDADDRLALRFGYPAAHARSVSRIAARTLEELTRLASELDAVRGVPAPEDVHVAAPVQQGILVEAARGEARGTYIEQLAVDLHGAVAAAALRDAWATVIGRHAALRSAFAAGFVVVRTTEEILARGFFETASLASGDDALDAWLVADRTRGFDPGSAPLLRVTLLERGEARTMVLTHHHAIADGWCVPLLLREAIAALSGEVLGPPPPPYREYVRWLGQQDRAAARAHFRRRLDGVARPTPPPRDRTLVVPGGAATSSTRRTVRRELSAGAVAATARLAREAGVTPSIVALAAYALTLGRMTGESRVAFAVTVHGRPADLEAAESMVGVLIQTLPFVVETAGDGDVVRWLAEVGTDLVRDQTHAHVGLGALHEEHPAAAVETLFVVENYPLRTPDRAAGLTFGTPRVARQVKAPFAFVVPPGPPAAEIDHDPSRVSEDDARDFLERYERVLEALAAAPAARVRQIGVLGADERARVLALAAAPTTTRAGLDARTLHARFLDAAAQVPERVAVSDEHGASSHAELASVAHALARRLVEAGVAPGDLVAVVAHAGVAHVAGVLGALLAGAAFVPFDPSYPEARLAAMFAAATPKAVLTAPLARELAARVAGAAPVLPIDMTARAPAGPLPSRLPHDRAYVLFTSGSTGLPKGVVCHHAGVEALLDDLDGRAPIPAGASTSQWTSPSFDVSVWEIFAALTRGSTLRIVPAAIRADARALVAWLDEQVIASAYLPGFALEALAEHVERGGCRALRRLLVGVEPIASHVLDRITAGAPDLVVVNGYGPTETSVCATLHTVTPADSRTAIVPIGRAVKGARVYVVDDRMEPVPARVPGEVVVAGVGVTHGYLDPADAAASRFVPDPFAPALSRAYRTGDRALALDDGTLVFLGRRDAQVKVRGVRIEIGEIDAALARLACVREGATVAMKSPAGTALVAGVVLREGDAARVRAELRSALPDAMVPGRVVLLEALPRDPNGKVDRRALLARLEAEPDEARGTWSTPTVEILGGLVRALVGVLPREDDDFLATGGDSLSATRLVSRIDDAFGVRLPLSAVFEAKSLRDLADRVDAARGEARVHLPALVAAGESVGPASFAQERLLFVDRLDPGNPVYNLACAVRLRGPLDVPVLRRALHEHVRRHGALRTVFEEVDGRWLQRVLAPRDVLDQVVVDLREDPDPLGRCRALVADDVRRPFDLARGPLVRARLFALGDGDHVLALGLHHVVADGWSLGIVLAEVLALYDAFRAGAPSPLPDLPVQYVDYARAQRAASDDARTAALVRMWSARLAGAPPLLELPTDLARPERQSFRGGHVRFAVDEALVRGVDGLARRAGATSAMVLLAALDALLMRWSGATDIPVGVSLANRRARAVEPLVGFFVDLVVVRAQLDDPRARFDTLLRHVRERSLEAYDHQDLPFDRLVDELKPRRTLAHAPLFQVNFVYDDAPVATGMRSLEVTPLDVETGTSRFDLALSLLRVDGRLEGTLEYNGDVFVRDTAEAMVAGFERLLAAVVEDARTPIDALPLGPAPAADAPLPIRRPPFVRAFEAAVRAVPDAVALASQDETLSYAELDRRSAHVAQVLRAYGVGPDVIVGVCAPRSISAVVAILAVLRAGGAFLPLDPDVPLARLAVMVEDAVPALVLTTEAVADLVPSAATNVLVLEELGAPPPGPVDAPATDEDTAEDTLAYVIYTSGSTGTPNGVAVTRRGLANLAAAQSLAFGITHGSRVLQFASLGFDASVSEIATALATGATLDLGTGSDRSDVASSLARVTVATLPPSLLAALEPAAYPHLVTVVSAGEALSADVARRWLDAGKRVVNAYGPTEATVCATLGEVTHDDLVGDRAPSIGRAMEGAHVHVVDARLVPVPAGVVGEIAIGGAGVARGYLGRDALTKARFVPDPFAPGGRLFLTGDRGRVRADGRLDFLGRADEQVKVRGHRIEAGDVEACLRRHSGVSDAAVVAAGEPKRLAAYVVPIDPAAAPSSDELAAFVAARLPAFMVPDRVELLDALPLTPSGKVDRRALQARLAAPPTPRAARVAPRDDIEAALAEAFAEVLRVPEVGVDDNFFELGGDSIVSIQLAARARRSGIVFDVKDLFLRQTVAELARSARRVEVAAVVDTPAEGDVPLTPIQRWFFEQRSPDLAYYNQSVLLEIEAPLRLEVLHEAARAVTAAHDALRLRFEREGDAWRQRYGEAEGSVVVESAPAGEIAAVRHRAHRSLDLARGPLARVVLFEGTPSRLFVVAHHLVIDAVSLRILVTDLLNAYRAIAAGGAPDLPAKTASYKAWAEALHASSLDLEAERRFLGELDRRRARLPVDGAPHGGDSRGAAITLATELDEAETESLVQGALPALGATVEQGLLTALGMALAPALAGAALVVDVEGHGRDALREDRPIDVTRTVGWFTSVTPVHVDTAAAGDVRAMLRGVKESTASVPRGGAGFGVLGYLGSGEIGLNYLGRVDGALERGVRLAVPDEGTSDDQSPRTPRPAQIEVQAMILGGRLRVRWTYLEARHRTATVATWSRALLDGLRAIAASASAKAAPVYATGDFPDAGLTADELAEVLEELEGEGAS